MACGAFFLYFISLNQDAFDFEDSRSVYRLIRSEKDSYSNTE